MLAIEQNAKVDVLHACGGNARCTTCRVEFIAGEPDTTTVAEKTVLAARGVIGARLSCQIAAPTIWSSARSAGWRAAVVRIQVRLPSRRFNRWPNGFPDSLVREARRSRTTPPL